MRIDAVALPALARLPAGWRAALRGPNRIDCDGFVVSVTPPGTPWLPNGVALGPGPETVWDPVVAPVAPGPALAARGAAILHALGAASTAGVAGALADGPLRPPRAAVAALFAALATGDAAAQERAARALLGRGPGLTPEGDDLVAGAAVAAAAAGEPLALPADLRTLTTPLSATLLELAAAGVGSPSYGFSVRLSRKPATAASTASSRKSPKFVMPTIVSTRTTTAATARPPVARTR